MLVEPQHCGDFIFGRVLMIVMRRTSDAPILAGYFANGVRHLFWDAGYGFELATVSKSGWAVVAGTVALTALTWIAGYAMRGGA